MLLRAICLSIGVSFQPCLLINHLADGGKGSIGILPLTRALAFSEYLETHAKRAYSAGSDPGLTSAESILSKIEAGQLKDGFTAREISQKHWANLSEANVKVALNLLTEYNWLKGSFKRTRWPTNSIL